MAPASRSVTQIGAQLFHLDFFFFLNQMENWAIPQLNVTSLLASAAANVSFLRGLAKFHFSRISFSWLRTRKVGTKTQLSALLFLASYDNVLAEKEQCHSLEKLLSCHLVHDCGDLQFALSISTHLAQIGRKRFLLCIVN